VNTKSLDSTISSINSSEILDWTKHWLREETPSYFWKVPSSSTGKYHPEFALGEGGLVRHTKAGIIIGKDLLTNVEPYRSWKSVEKDKIISALALHDTRKHGYPKKSRYSNASHGMDLAKAIIKQASSDFEKDIASLVSSHMGRWNKSYTSNKVVAPKPGTTKQMFVHECDYLASRKYVDFDFS